MCFFGFSINGAAQMNLRVPHPLRLCILQRVGSDGQTAPNLCSFDFLNPQALSLTPF